MSGAFSLFLEQSLLNHVFGSAAYARPSGLWVAVYTSAPTQAGGGIEVSGGNYSRQQATFNMTVLSPPTMQNVAAVQFPAASANWGTIVAGALFDAQAGGNMLASSLLVSAPGGTIPDPKPINVGDVFRIPVGYLQVGFAAGF